MILEVKDSNFVDLMKPFDVLSKTKSSRAKETLQSLSDAFDRIGSSSTESKIALRITNGPTNTAIKFHVGDLGFTRNAEVALNSSDEYEGGRHCFYVFENLEILDNFPIGSVVIYPSDILRATTTLTKGILISLLVVDKNEYSPEDVIKKDDIEEFLISL